MEVCDNMNLRRHNNNLAVCSVFHLDSSEFVERRSVVCPLGTIGPKCVDESD